jgi:hypothetical protein
MQFLDGPNGTMGREFAQELHPATRRMILEFDTFSDAQGWPEPVITEVGRSIKQMQLIYVPYYQNLQHLLLTAPETLGPSDRQRAVEIRGKTQAELMELAGKRFSWHCVNTAVDVRTFHYTKEQLAKVDEWFKARCKRPEWEYLIHDVAGPHIHLGNRDFKWKEKQLVARREHLKSVKPDGGKNA